MDFCILLQIVRLIQFWVPGPSGSGLSPTIPRRVSGSGLLGTAASGGDGILYANRARLELHDDIFRSRIFEILIRIDQN
jgi:hypothetical protein